MKKIDRKTLFLTSTIFLVIAVLTVSYYSVLPDRLAIHFNLDNQPNQYAAKYLVTLIAPTFLFVLHLFLSICYDLAGIGKKPAIQAVKWSFPLLALGIQSSLLFYNAGGAVDYRRLVIGLLAIFYLFLGNYMPKDRQGDKVDDREWQMRRKTAYLFLGGGLSLLLSLFGPAWFSFLVLGLFGLLALSWSGYCFYISRKWLSS